MVLEIPVFKSKQRKMTHPVCESRNQRNIIMDFATAIIFYDSQAHKHVRFTTEQSYLNTCHFVLHVAIAHAWTRVVHVTCLIAHLELAASAQR